MNENLNFFDRLFRDGTGEIVAVQAPNIPILVWISATLLKFVVKDDRVKIGLDILAFSSLLYWSVMEITAGVTYFRRDLGVIVLITIITSIIWQFGKMPAVTGSSNRLTS
jgi:hypothetical protein